MFKVSTSLHKKLLLCSTYQLRLHNISIPTTIQKFASMTVQFKPDALEYTESYTIRRYYDCLH
jgi:hypothetical protein